MDSSRIIPRELPRVADGFELIEELGRGGMGVVYRARELSTNRVIALKVLPYSMQDKETAFDRFHREAILAASISDPRCVFVYGAHSVEQSPAIAMELVEGQTLEHVIQRGEKIPVAQAVRWTIELLEGLEAAHRANVLHRDVKPSNCFLGADGRIKVGDFGLSRSIETHVHLTDPGQFIGSPLYASPEQIRGREVDERSDLYSAAATLYALLTGRPGWQGSNVQEVFARILSEPPDDVCSLRKEVPRPLAKVIARAMEKDPAKRHQTLQELREALHPFAQAALPAHPGRRLAAYLADTAVLGLFNSALLGLGAAWLLSSNSLTQEELQKYSILVSFPTAFLYFSMMEGWLGMSVGKWALGLRVHDAISGVPVWHRTMLRTLIYMVPSSVPYLFLDYRDPILAFAVIPLQLLLLIPGRKRNGWMYLHEWASGTRTTQTSLPFPRFTRQLRAVERESRAVDAEARILGLHRLDGHLATTSHGELYSAEDALLTRKVWVLAGKQPLHFPLQGRASRLHWLGSFEAEGLQCQVLEAPGGDTLGNWRAAQDELAWEVILRQLLELSEALAEDKATDYQLGQLWIDRSGRLKLLPFAIQEGEAQRMTATQLLGHAARLLIGERHVLPRDMPGAGDEVMQRLLGMQHGYESIQDAASALKSMTQGPLAVTRRQRAFQTLLTAMVMAFYASVMVVSVMTADKAGPLRDHDETFRAITSLGIAFSIVFLFVPLSMLTRGGLIFRMFGMLLRTPSGRRAGALICGLRTFLFLLPAVLILLASAALADPNLIVLGVVMLSAYGVLLVTSIVWPHATLVDRLLGTRIVPRG